MLCAIRGSPASNTLRSCLFRNRLRSWLRFVTHPPYCVVSFHSPGGVQVVFLLKSAARPETIPASLATIKLIQDTNQGFINELWMITFHARSIRENFHQIRQLYEISDIQNKVPDGKISFPEDSRSLASGVTVEFRCVTCSSNPSAPQVTETLGILCA